VLLGRPLASALLLASIAVGAMQSPATAAPSCADDKRVVRACIKLHGKMYVPANMRTEIQPLDGSKHIYAIHILEPGGGPADFDPPLPDNAMKLLDPDHDVYGDFTVCPFTHDVPGHLQIGCVDKAQRLVIRKHSNL